MKNRSISFLCAAAGLLLASCTPSPTAPNAGDGPAGPAAAVFWSARCPDQAHATCPIGINLEGPADWMRTPMFVNAMKTSRTFGSPDQPWSSPAPVDADGNPTADFGACVITGQPHIGGTYHFSALGKVAEIRPVACQATVRNLRYDPATNRSAAEIDVPDTATQLYLGFKGADSGLKDIRLIRPGYPADTKQIFTDAFTASLKPFGAIRLMDYLATNGSKVARWSERNTPQTATFTNGRGGPYEDAIALANASGKDLWINIPALADDDYVRRLAGLLKSSLSPDRHVYLEYSNEVWNWSFAASRQNVALAKAEIAAGSTIYDAKVCPEDQPDGDSSRLWKRTAKRIVEIAAIFQDVYGKSAMMTTVRPVLASQIAYPIPLTVQMAFIAQHYGAPRNYLYAVAGAPYFGIGPDSTGQPLVKRDDLTVDQIAQSMRQSIADYASGGLWSFSRIAREYGVRFFAYEGGPDIGFGGTSLTARIAVNWDPRMKDMLSDYLSTWYRCGGGLFMYFSHVGAFGPHGAWGITDDITKPSPKSAALEEVLTQPEPSPIAGTSIPGALTASSYGTSLWGKPLRPHADNSPIGTLTPGAYMDFLVNVRQAGRYRVTAQAAGGSAPPLEIQVNEFQPSAVDAQSIIVLDAGLQSIRLTTSGAPISLLAVRFDPAR